MDIRGANGRDAMGDGTTRLPGGQSRWSAGKDLSWEPLRIERVCEVKYDHMQGDRFRHAAIFLRWRLDRQPKDCRYDQLEVTTPLRIRESLPLVAESKKRDPAHDVGVLGVSLATPSSI